jgi:hypothetical protein
MNQDHEVKLLSKLTAPRAPLYKELSAHFVHGFFVGLDYEFGRFFQYFAFLGSSQTFEERAKLFLLKWLSFIL